MATLSKLHDKCEKCKYRDSCNNKRMVACRLVETSKPDMKNGTLPNTEPLTQPLSRKHTSITINMGGYGNINTSMEQIAKQINKAFEINCAFNKS
ncbi:hypothetical protein KPL30_02845 [Clostridium algidicarnis]|nr:hypothetical protein [Clostridium algidicarnis]MBU3203119.1 hypothetical protein [Clostridium algidicarnis]MBU3211273.1 hypothetical protein [Clostridium algidicarnis]MBU3222219.1 hypothetical protein [Clostridium algidicarnis]